MNLVILNSNQKELIESFRTIPPFDGMITTEPGFKATLDPSDQSLMTQYRGQLLSLCVEIENELVFLRAYSEVGNFGNDLNDIINQRAKSGFVSKKSTFIKWYKKEYGKIKSELVTFIGSADFMNKIRDSIAHHAISGFKCEAGFIPFIFNGRETIIFDKSCIDHMQNAIDELFSHFGEVRKKLNLPLTGSHERAINNARLENEKR